jgi:hypothetical protein
MYLSFLNIQEKAMSLFKDLKLKAQEDGIPNADDLEFQASHDWFETFKTCANLHSLHTSGERVSADVAAAMKFPKELIMITKHRGYSPKQIFSVDETGLFWKRMLS